MPTENFDKIGKVTAASVKKHTKKNWNQWVSLLNQQGYQNLNHKELVQLLKTKFKINMWWQQEVARGYQIAIGRRVEQQTLKGTYTTTATKTLSVSKTKLYKFLLSEEGQLVWLEPMTPAKIKKGVQFECYGGVYGDFRTIKPAQLLRLSWHNEDWDKKSTLQVHLYPKKSTNCLLVFSHVDLPTLTAKNQMHSKWSKALDKIAEKLN